MARPKKLRQVCGLPRHTAFTAADSEFSRESAVVMTVEEYETVRLIDHEGHTQEECALDMGIARTTVQQLYNDARKKLAAVLVEGKSLWINGGKYHISGEGRVCCGRCGRSGCCQRRQQKETAPCETIPIYCPEKGAES